MVQHSIANARLMDMSQFRVTNVKRLVRIRLPLFFKQRLMQIKDVFLKVESKRLHIRALHLTLLKFAPSGK